MGAGDANLQVPVYSHETYDIVPDRFQTVDRPGILIFEGLNVLQTTSQAATVASDFFDFVIYIDTGMTTIEAWYVERFLLLQRTAVQSPSSFFYRFKDLTAAQAEEIARRVWQTINLPNLIENVQPTRERADLVIRKGDSHRSRRFGYAGPEPLKRWSAVSGAAVPLTNAGHGFITVPRGRQAR